MHGEACPRAASWMGHTVPQPLPKVGPPRNRTLRSREARGARTAVLAHEPIRRARQENSRPESPINQRGFRWVLTVAVVIGALLAATSPVEASDPSWDTLGDRALAGVVRVLVETDRWITCGSGVIVSNCGYILTAAHVLEHARRVMVVVEGNREFEARIMDRHPRSDVALLSITAPDLRPLPVGSAAQLQDGEEICVIGYPECGSTLVKANGRIGTSSATHHAVWYNAPIQPGHSGGPVLNTRGEVVAVHFERPAAEGGGRGVTIDVALTLIPYGEQLSFLYPRRFTVAGTELHSVALSPSGRLLAAGTDDGRLALWDVGTGRRMHTLTGHRGPVWDIAFCDDAAFLASASGDGSVIVWDASSGARLHTLSGDGNPVFAVAMAPQGQRLATGSWSGTVTLWDRRTGELLGTLQGHTGPIGALAFGPDGNQLASGAADGVVKLWDTDRLRESNTLIGHTNWVRSVAFNADGNSLASASEDGTARLWQVTTPREALATLDHKGRVQTVTFLHGDALLVTASEDASLEIWKLAHRERLKTVNTGPSPIASLTANAPAMLLASASIDGTITLFPLP